MSVYSGAIFIATKFLLYITSLHNYRGYRYEYIQLLSSTMVRGVTGFRKGDTINATADNNREDIYLGYQLLLGRCMKHLMLVAKSNH